VLEAAYEATMRAAIEQAAADGSNTVLLTRLGGGAFGNAETWIDDAIVQALSIVETRRAGHPAGQLRQRAPVDAGDLRPLRVSGALGVVDGHDVEKQRVSVTPKAHQRGIEATLSLHRHGQPTCAHVASDSSIDTRYSSHSVLTPCFSA
jgi:hypothetical protein